MATQVMDLGRTVGSGARSTLGAQLRRFSEKLTASRTWYRAYRQTEHELGALSDRELDDIGIPRADIPLVSKQSADEIVKAASRSGYRC